MTEIGWGQYAQVESYGSASHSEEFVAMSYEDAKSQYQHYMHAAHGMVWAPDNSSTFDLYPRKAAVLMQLRFDGYLGFPGGLLDQGGEEPWEALNREAEEEIGLDLKKYRFTAQDHVVTHRNDKKTLILHFYTLKVTLEDIKEIEKAILNAFEFGRETLGPLRVPLYTMGDGFRGLPVFLANRFAGNAKQQLLLAIRREKILSEEELNKALEAFAEYWKTYRQ